MEDDKEKSAAVREALKKAAELRVKVAAENSLDIGDRAVKRKKDKVQAPPSQKVTPEPKIARSTSSVSLTTTASSVAPKSLAMSFDQAADEGVAATSTAGDDVGKPLSSSTTCPDLLDTLPMEEPTAEGMVPAPSNPSISPALVNPTSVAAFESMDPSQLAFIKHLIVEAEAKRHTAPAETTNTETKPASVGGTHAEVSMERPAPVATPCRTDATIPAPSKTSVEYVKNADGSENNGQTSAKLKQFWSKYVVSPEAAKPAENITPPTASAPSATATPATTALDSPGADTQPDEPMPPAPEPSSSNAPTPAPSAAPAAKPDEPMSPAETPKPAETRKPAETPKPEVLSRREQVRAKVMKMDALQYETLVKESVAHPYFETYFKMSKPTDPEDEVEDAVNWLMWLDEQLYAPDSPDPRDPGGICRLPTLILGETHPTVESPPAEIPQSKPTETQPAQKTPPAVPTASVDNVRTTLLRATTVDLQKSPGTAPEVITQLEPKDPKVLPKVEPTAAAATPAAQPPNAPAVTPSQRPNNTAETAEDKATAPNEAAQKKIRAIKGKFHRSIRSKYAPPEVVAKQRELAGSRDPKAWTQLFEEWLQADQDWLKSSLIVTTRNERENALQGQWKLMSKAELDMKYTDTTLVDDLIERKVAEGMTAENPDFPGRKEPHLMLYWCWDSTTSTDTSRNSSAVASSSSGAIRNTDASAFSAGNLPMVADPGDPKGAGKGKGVVDDGQTGNGEKGKPKAKAKPKGKKGGGEAKEGDQNGKPKTKTPEQESRSAMKTAADLILECKSWESKLKSSNTPQDLITALVRDMAGHLGGLEQARGDVEAAIAAGQEGDSLLTVNQTLAQRISDYKKAAGHCKKHAPKAKPKASAKSAATPPEP